ncbi:MAG: hypothetical protein ACRD3G_11440 [Vicinamibacterales bacterium]
MPKLLWTYLSEQRAADRQALVDERSQMAALLVEVRGLHMMYERQVAALRVGHAAAIARADRAEVELARAHATVEWMASHANLLEHHNAELQHRVYGINALAMNVDTSALGRRRDTPPTTTRVDGEMAGTTTEDEPLADMSELMETESVAALFEDVGDRRAKKMGYGDWDDAGAVTTQR